MPVFLDALAVHINKPVAKRSVSFAHRPNQERVRVSIVTPAHIVLLAPTVTKSLPITIRNDASRILGSDMAGQRITVL
jgi:hypothetical protein